jgi:hypothetical protein
VSSERERRYLEHIAESIRLIDDYVGGGRTAFFERTPTSTLTSNAFGRS